MRQINHLNRVGDADHNVSSTSVTPSRELELAKIQIRQLKQKLERANRKLYEQREAISQFIHFVM
jgi:hypothetical protein